MSLMYLTEVSAAPGTPDANKFVFYVKSDGLLYFKNDAGVETPFKPVGAGTGDLLSDGTVPLSANWDIGSFQLRAETFQSDVATGTPPFVVASTTVVANLNASLLEGNAAAAFATSAQGDLADTSVQPADLGTAAAADVGDFATAAQGDAADAAKAKTDFLTITQSVNLDAIETRVNELDAAVVLVGEWDASVGTFPGGGTAQAGQSWIVSVAGTVDGVAFGDNDRIIAITDNASTATYAANWHKADYTDEVLSVAGLIGAISAANLRTAINVEDGATADQTGAEIKAAYEAEADTNALTDARAAKVDALAGWQTDNDAITAALGDRWYYTGSGHAATFPGTFDKGSFPDMIQFHNGGTGNLALTPSAGDSLIVNGADLGADVAYDLEPGRLAICIPDTADDAWSVVVIGVSSGAGGMTVTPVKTANYTANENEVVPVDSTGGAFTITMPASATAQARVIIMDVGKACGTNNVTLARNGATFDGVAEDFVIDQNHGRVDAASDGSDDWITHLIGSPNAIDVAIDEAQVDARVVAVASGVESRDFSVSDMWEGGTNAPGAEITLGSVGVLGQFRARPFDTSTSEVLFFTWRVPNNYDPTAGLSFDVQWSATNTNTGSVRWEIRPLALSDGEVIDDVQIADGCFADDNGQGTAGTILQSAQSGRKFISNLAKGDIVSIRLLRRTDVDDYNADANFISLTLYWTTDAPTED